MLYCCCYCCCYYYILGLLLLGLSLSLSLVTTTTTNNNNNKTRPVQYCIRRYITTESASSLKKPATQFSLDHDKGTAPADPNIELPCRQPRLYGYTTSCPVTLTNGLKMDGSLARAFARYLLESVPVPAVPRVRVSCGLTSQLPSSDDPALFFPFNVFTEHHHTLNYYIFIFIHQTR